MGLDRARMLGPIFLSSAACAGGCFALDFDYREAPASASSSSSAGAGGAGGASATTSGSGGGEVTCENSAWQRPLAQGPDNFGPVVAMDRDGSVAVAAGFFGTVDLGLGPLTAQGNQDVLVAKLSAANEPLWNLRFGSPINNPTDQATGVVVDDSDGSVVVAGIFESQLDLGGGAFTCVGNPDGFAVKLGSSGQHIWSLQLVDMQVSHVALDPAGGPVVGGYITDPTSIGGIMLPFAGGSGDAAVVALDTNGEPRWGRVFGDGNFQRVNRVAADQQGNVYIAGYFNGSIPLADQYSAAGTHAFLAKLDSDGNPLWSTYVGGPGGSTALGSAVDASGGVVLAGYFIGDVIVGGAVQLSEPGDIGVFVARFDAAGQLIWARSFGGEKDQLLHGLFVDDADRIFLTGDFQGTVDFGGAPITGTTTDDWVFVAALAGDGSHLYSSAFGANDGKAKRGYRIAGDGCGNVVVTGMYNGSLDFGLSPPLPQVGTHTGFLVRLQPLAQVP